MRRVLSEDMGAQLYLSKLIRIVQVEGLKDHMVLGDVPGGRSNESDTCATSKLHNWRI